MSGTCGRALGTTLTSARQSGCELGDRVHSRASGGSREGEKQIALSSDTLIKSLCVFFRKCVLHFHSMFKLPQNPILT